jgi:hypothetical protein
LKLEKLLSMYRETIWPVTSPFPTDQQAFQKICDCLQTKPPNLLHIPQESRSRDQIHRMYNFSKGGID